MLFLDVKAAFPSVVVERALHNMHKRRIPLEYIEWYQRRLQNRTTTLNFDDYKLEEFNVENGVDQGCPLSVIIFIFYNADLLDIADANEGTLSLGFIDDVSLIARGRSFAEANEKLRNMMEKEGGALDWSRDQNAEFELEKMALLCISRSCIAHPAERNKTIPTPREPITMRGQRIIPTPSHKFLGVIIDHELRFKEHATYALAKGTKYVLACGRMARPTKGIRGRLMRKLYEGVVVPKMLYAVDVWGAGLVKKGKGKKNKGRGVRGFASKMARVQRMAAILITGGMRTTATDVLDAHANLLPFQQLLWKVCCCATLRMAMLPPTHPLYAELRKAVRQRKRHRTPVHELLREFGIDPRAIEKVDAVRHNPKWEPDTVIEIAPSKEEAFLADEAAQEEVRIYSDRSAIDGGVGVAAVLTREGRDPKVLHFHLGTSTKHTVYKAEIV